MPSRKRPAISQLEAFYTKIAGELQADHEQILAAGIAGPALAEHLRADMDARRETIRSIEVCLRLFDPDWTPARISLKRPRKNRRHMDRGSLLSMAYEVLRDAKEPINSQDILRQLWHRGRLKRQDADDTVLRNALTQLLVKQEALGAVTHEGEKPYRWAIIWGEP